MSTTLAELYTAWRADNHNTDPERWGEQISNKVRSDIYNHLESLNDSEFEQIPDVLYDEVDELIWTEWDPLQVNNLEECRDEYSGAVALITETAFFGSKLQLAAQLYELQVFYYGIEHDGAVPRCVEVAGLIKGRMPGQQK